MYFLILLAQEGKDQAQPQGGDAFSFFLPLILIFFIGYFLLVRPMKRQEQQRQALINAVKKNDKVIAAGGIIGIVASIKDKEDEVTLKVDDSSNVRIKVTRSSIIRVLNAADGPKESKEEEVKND